LILYFVGALNGNYDLIRGRLDPRPDWVLCVGSFGAWPDPQAVDRATKKKGVGEFPEHYLQQTTFPYPTLFVEGTHDDHRWLHKRSLKGNFSVLPNVTHLSNGNTTTIGDTQHSLQVLGLGKPYSDSYALQPIPFSPWDRSWYTRAEVATACAAGPVDILLTHEGLHGEQYGKFQCKAQGIQKIIYATRPKLFVHGHFNTFRQYRFLETDCYSLANGQVLRAEYNGQSFNCSIVH